MRSETLLNILKYTILINNAEGNPSQVFISSSRVQQKQVYLLKFRQRELSVNSEQCECWRMLMFDWLVWTEQKRREGNWSESDTVSLLPHRCCSHAIRTRLQRPGRREEDKPDRTHRPGHGNTFDSEHKHAITPSRCSRAPNTAITSRETRLSLLTKTLNPTLLPSPDLLTWEEVKVHTRSKRQHFYFTLLNLDRTRNSPN